MDSIRDGLIRLETWLQWLPNPVVAGVIVLVAW
jgi:hypothetical protein